VPAFAPSNRLNVVARVSKILMLFEWLTAAYQMSCCT